MSELIERTYAEAAKGINGDWFLNANTNWYEYIVNLPLNQKIAYLIIVLNNQVSNGGFHQYFVNGYGQFALETIKALLEIGAEQRAQLLAVAYNTVNKDHLTQDIFRTLLLEKSIKSLFVTDELYEPLNDLDIQYYTIDNEDIENLLGIFLERQ